MTVDIYIADELLDGTMRYRGYVACGSLETHIYST